MNTSEQQYYSYVTNRIQALRAKMSRPSTSALEKEFLESKMAYLRKLIDLPILISIDHMTEDELELVEKKYGTRDRDFIVSLFGLEKLDSFLKGNRIIPLQYMKEAMVQDPESMEKLIQLHEANWAYRNRIQALQGVGLHGNPSCQQASFDEKALNVHSVKVENAIKDAKENFNVETLKEVVFYSTHRAKPLSDKFIAKHISKIEKDPKMKLLSKRLSGKGLLGKIDKFLPGRREREKEFLNAVINNYNSSKTLTTLCIKKKDIRAMDEKYINALVRVIDKQSTKLRGDIYAKRLEIQSSRTSVVDELKTCEAARKGLKKEFMSILSTKTKFLPKIFQDQIWDEPDLRATLKIADCFKEEREIIDALNKMQKDPIVPLKVNVDNVEANVTTEDAKTYTKKAA